MLAVSGWMVDSCLGPAACQTSDQVRKFFTRGFIIPRGFLEVSWINLVTLLLQFHGSYQSPTMFDLAMESRSRHTIDCSFWWRSVTFTPGQYLTSMLTPVYHMWVNFFVTDLTNLCVTCAGLGLAELSFPYQRARWTHQRYFTPKIRIGVPCTSYACILQTTSACLLNNLNGSPVSAGVLAMAWCPCDSSMLLTCSKDNQTLCWDTGSGEVHHQYQGSQFRICPGFRGSNTSLGLKRVTL